MRLSPGRERHAIPRLEHPLEMVLRREAGAVGDLAEGSRLFEELFEPLEPDVENLLKDALADGRTKSLLRRSA